MSAFFASENSLTTDPMRLPIRERLLEEYAQAVDSYQKIVQELDQTPARDPQAVESLLAKADAAKETLDQCRNRYCLYADKN